jgi:hypothetical protein
VPYQVGDSSLTLSLVRAEVATWLGKRARYLNGDLTSGVVPAACYPTSDDIIDAGMRMIRASAE